MFSFLFSHTIHHLRLLYWNAGINISIAGFQICVSFSFQSFFFCLHHAAYVFSYSFPITCNLRGRKTTRVQTCPGHKKTYLELCGHDFKAFYLWVLQGGVGGNGTEHLQDLVEPPLERVKLSKNVHLTEVELPLVGSLLELLFGLVETMLVLL